MQERHIGARRVGSAGREVTQRTWKLDAHSTPPARRPRRPRRRDHTAPFFGAQADLAALPVPVMPTAAPPQPIAQDLTGPGSAPAAAAPVAPVQTAPEAPPKEKRSPPTRTPSAAARRRAIRRTGGLVGSPREPVASAPAVALPPLSPNHALARRRREGILTRALRWVLRRLGWA